MKNWYTIHQISKLLGISADAIRLYEKEGLVTPVRNPQNGYRYYETQEIQRIMGIHLYRQLNVSIAEIRNLMSSTSLPEVADGFASLTLQTENEIEHLQKRLEKLRFMKQHLDNLIDGQLHCSIRDLPAFYTLYHQDFSQPLYSNMKDILTSPIFSFGNFCYSLEKTDHHFYRSKALQFAVREPMMNICPWANNADSFPRIEGCRCIYSVVEAPVYSELNWHLENMISYANEQGVTCSPNAYAFYIFSLVPKDTIIDYYEVYLPILS